MSNKYTYNVLCKSNRGIQGGINKIIMTDHIVEEIKSKCDIVDVIGRQIPLKQAGMHYRGVCPFHQEKTPSFFVSASKQNFTCYGCGASGDVIEFVQRYHHLDFRSTIEKLADEYGIEINTSGFQSEKKRAELYELNREAASFFYRCFTRKPNPADEYMKKRGLEPNILKKFGIGYADEQWDSLYRYFMEKKVKPEVLLELGLLSFSKGKYFDKFRGRVIFPIINTRGKVIGFGGRTLNDGTPKYLNSPESTVFSKKSNLYGLNLTRQDINKEGNAILVEGYMDVISLYQHGVRNVSASLGTALTENQAGMLRRYGQQVVLAYDGDAAGQAAADRGLDVLRKAGCKAKVLLIHDGKDPDDFIKKNGRESFLSLVQNALPYADYKISRIKERWDIDTTEGKVGFLQEASRLLQRLSPVEADVYVKKIASETNISEGAIRLEVYGDNRKEGLSPAETGNLTHEVRSDLNQRTKMKSITVLEKYLIRLMLLKGSFVERIKPYAWIFTHPHASRIYEVILSLYQEDEEVELNKVKDSLEQTENMALQDILDNVHLADKEEQVFQDCMVRIEKRRTLRREREIIQLLSDLEDEKDGNLIEQLTKELMELQIEIRK